MFDMWQAMGANPRGDRLERIKQSPQHKNGRFRNELNPTQDIWKAMGEMAGNRQNRTPSDPLPVIPRHTGDFDHGAEDLRLTWFGHSSVLIEIGGKKVLTDPVWGPRTSPSPVLGPKRFHDMPMALDQLPQIDAVAISHDHYDHLDYPTIKYLAQTDTKFYVPLGVGSHLTYWGVAEERIHEMDWWDTAELDQVKITLTPSRHFSGRGLVRDKTLWGGWAIISEKHRVYFSGDSGMFPGFKEIGDRLGPFDVTLMESGAYNAAWPDVHMGPEQAVQAHRMVRGDLLIPVHWGTFSLAAHSWTEPAERVLAAAEKKGVQAYVPRQGEFIVPGQLPEQTRWWPDIQWQSSSQAPVISTSLPKNLEVEMSGY